MKTKILILLPILVFLAVLYQSWKVWSRKAAAAGFEEDVLYLPFSEKVRAAWIALPNINNSIFNQ